MLNEFKQYLLGIGKSENTALNYCDKVKLYFKWCLDSFGSEPQQLYRANVLDYISYMKTIKRYNPKSVNNHLSSLRSFNEFLIASRRQTELAIIFCEIRSNRISNRRDKLFLNRHAQQVVLFALSVTNIYLTDKFAKCFVAFLHFFHLNRCISYEQASHYSV